MLGSLDGWDPDSSKNILIENSFGWAGDDAVAVKCTGKLNDQFMVRNAENITVRGNVFLTKKSGLKIGTETFCSQMQNIVFVVNMMQYNEYIVNLIFYYLYHVIKIIQTNFVQYMMMLVQ